MTDRPVSTEGEVLGPAGARPATSRLSAANRRDHVLARLGVRREQYRVEPGLYALGAPGPDSPVFVTANYTLSFDALRCALRDTNAYLLVLNTFGINVWCAAGKGTFGTDELVRRIEATGLSQVVRHRAVILPQLGAPGVAAHEVKRRSGFRVEYGPVRAADLSEYMKAHQATPEMRRVRFALADRLTLIPVELVHVGLPVALAAAVLWLLGGRWLAAGALAVVLAGVVLFPILLPWLPTHAFSSKGLVLGALAALPLAAAAVLAGPAGAGWWRVGRAAACFLLVPAATAYLGLNFTGSTPFTSRTGVRRETMAYIPVLAGLAGSGAILAVALAVLQGLAQGGG